MSYENGHNSIDKYSQYWKNKSQKRKEDLKEHRQELRKWAEKCAILLKKKYNVKKVYLIGSLVSNTQIHEKTDIDIVVAGLSDKEYFNALNSLYKIIPKGVDIDLITIETANEWIKNSI